MKVDAPLHYHVVGVAGVGMNAIAQVLQDHGFSVSGSDRYYDTGVEMDVLNCLQSRGVRLTPQDGDAVTSSTTGLVVSTAIEDDNPDLLAARKLNVPIIHRADMLAKLSRDHDLAAVAGTSGKTTVTGMAGWLLEQCGRDPFVVDGGAVINWSDAKRIGNVRQGSSGLWLVEVDESDRSLLHFNPRWAVITNISKDHFELHEVQELFRQFASRVSEAIVCTAQVAAVLEGAATSAEIIVETYRPRDERSGGFEYKDVHFEVPLLGSHNVENAFSAVALCDRMGLDLEVMSEAMRSFKGIERRLEKVGVAHGVAVFDDYAHNPAKIQAACRAVASDDSKTIAVWRPHGYGPLSVMRHELIAAIRDAMREGDEFLLLPVYYAGGTTQADVTSEEMVGELQKAGVSARYVSSYDAALDRIVSTSEEGDSVICMGARDPELPKFARRVVAALNE